MFKWVRYIFEKFNYQPVVIVIVGPTGVGKSKLAIDLAKHFNGEIINSDSMQIYKGLDITTNKVPEKEQKNVLHHMLDILDPQNTSFSASDYKNQTSKIIKQLICQNKMPFIVGGTNYYIESILWDFLITTPKNTFFINSDYNAALKTLYGKYSHSNILNLTTNPYNILNDMDVSLIPSKELHELLSSVDKDRALILHPNERRKIIRNLQIYETTGQKPSSILQKQKNFNDTRKSGSLLYKGTIMLWLDCPQNILHNRIERRVDTMLKTGWIEELKAFASHINYEDNLNKGLFQNIGFKEFINYIKSDCKDENKKHEAIKLYINTIKKYAKYQNKWIVNRFLNRTENDIPYIYKLNINEDDSQFWYKNIYLYAIDIISLHLNNKNMKYPKIHINKLLMN